MGGNKNPDPVGDPFLVRCVRELEELHGQWERGEAAFCLEAVTAHTACSGPGCHILTKQRTTFFN